jgi:hypothetical protein
VFFNTRQATQEMVRVERSAGKRWIHDFCAPERLASFKVMINYSYDLIGKIGYKVGIACVTGLFVCIAAGSSALGQQSDSTVLKKDPIPSRLLPYDSPMKFKKVNPPSVSVRDTVSTQIELDRHQKSVMRRMSSIYPAENH